MALIALHFSATTPLCYVLRTPGALVVAAGRAAALAPPAAFEAAQPCRPPRAPHTTPACPTHKQSTNRKEQCRATPPHLDPPCPTDPTPVWPRPASVGQGQLDETITPAAATTTTTTMPAGSHASQQVTLTRPPFCPCPASGGGAAGGGHRSGRGHRTGAAGRPRGGGVPLLLARVPGQGAWFQYRFFLVPGG